MLDWFFFSQILLTKIHYYCSIVLHRDIEKIRDGIAEKVSHFLFLIIGFLICVVMSFVYGWKLSLVVISYVPIVMITNTIIGKVSKIVFFNAN